MNSMKRYTLGFVVALIVGCLTGQAQTVWTGAPVTIHKIDSADWTLAENQDRITDSVWITRQHSKAFYNIARESGYTGSSPIGTEWAIGSIDSFASLTYQPFIKTTQGGPQEVIDTPMVLHLIQEDIYISFKLLSFSGLNKGGFKYERSTDPSVGIPSLEQSNTAIYPNPAHDFLQLDPQLIGQEVTIYAITGEEITTVTVPLSGKLKLDVLSSGTYLLRSNGTQTQRFVKQ